jgi:hypothetical protein
VDIDEAPVEGVKGKEKLDASKNHAQETAAASPRGYFRTAKNGRLMSYIRPKFYRNKNNDLPDPFHDPVRTFAIRQILVRRSNTRRART